MLEGLQQEVSSHPSGSATALPSLETRNGDQFSVHPSRDILRRYNYIDTCVCVCVEGCPLLKDTFSTAPVSTQYTPLFTLLSFITYRHHSFHFLSRQSCLSLFKWLHGSQSEDDSEYSGKSRADGIVSRARTCA